MWIIKNRVTGEYERRGMYGERDRFNRHAWDSLAQAKCHVSLRGYDEWFMESDFIEVSEEGTGRIIPVSEYLREYYDGKRHTPDWIKRRLGLSEE